MPDLFTHLATARLPAAFVRDPRIAALVVIGTFLPDLTSKGFYWVLKCTPNFEVPTHSLVGVTLISYAASLFLEERLRRAAFPALLAGGVLHVLVDLLKDNMGVGSCRLFYPFSPRSYELGLIDPVDVIYLVPIDLILLWVAGAIERSRRVRG
ncbi:MAG TPA: metal-dependent hydrolase [Planctomycetota bacterium]|nr:metal-dependent hydrolase [Planctomycetota bacterium]